jgi:cytochrome c oxidase subunit III
VSVAALDSRSQPRAFWGITLLVATEATLLAAVVGTYWYLRFKSARWPPPTIPEPKVLWPLVLTGVLVASALPVLLAARAATAGRARAAFLALLCATLVQAAYLALQIELFREDLADFEPQEHAYASVYYVLVGADHAHVAIGLLIDVFLLAKLVGGLTPYRAAGVRAAAFYWSFVAVFSVIIVLTQVSPSL